MLCSVVVLLVVVGFCGCQWWGVLAWVLRLINNSMEIQTLLVLALTVFSSALLQAATGIGYGVIAGPVFLVALNGAEAIQISTMHNLLIAVVLFPFIRSNINKQLLLPIVAGSCLGIAAGFYLQVLLETNWLKIMAACMVFFVMTSLVLDISRSQRQLAQPLRKAPRKLQDGATVKAGFVGLMAGVMGGMLAMPGPLVATWLSLRGFGKNEIRATVLAFFIFSYGANFFLYLLLSGLDTNALRLTAGFAPLVLLGVVCGHIVAKYLTEILFRKIILLILIATISSLLFSIFLANGNS